MQTAQASKIRKGTKSCTECRRRKVRCIQSFENAQVCRRCEERGSQCISQTHTSRSVAKQRISSKDRIAQLEAKVLSLTETIHEMGQNPTGNTQSTQNEHFSVNPEEISDWASPVSEQSIAEQPFHLRLLFQNDLLSVDGSSAGRVIQNTFLANATPLLNSARKSLQRLIPSKEEISVYTDSASEWLTMLHSLFPLPSCANCVEKLISGYEEMHYSDVDIIRLASWLLTIALIAEQLPPKYDDMESWFNERDRQMLLSNTISTTVENRILIHDSLTSSIEGLSLFMQYIRLEIGRGNIHQAWLKLRHVIALAELMGLHNIARNAPNRVTTEAVDESQTNEIRLWDWICASDRLLGMMLNISPITSRHQQAMPQVVSINGIVQSQAYLCQLTTIANKVQDLDQFSKSNGPISESYTLALELSRELEGLASQTPETWWSGGMYGTNNAHPDHITQFLHYYIAMRIHLPLTLRQCSDDENVFSRLACISACESMVQRYQFLSRRLPPGLFLSELLDLQAFSAAVTLLLISHNSSARLFNVGIDKRKINNEVDQVVRILREKSDSPLGSGIAYNGFTTLCSVNDLLQEREKGVGFHEITFHAPLIGKVQVRRNDDSSSTDSAWSSQIMSTLGLYNGEIPFPDLSFDTSTSMEAFLDEENVQWERITSSTEGILRGLS